VLPVSANWMSLRRQVPPADPAACRASFGKLATSVLSATLNRLPRARDSDACMGLDEFSHRRTSCSL